MPTLLPPVGVGCPCKGCVTHGVDRSQLGVVRCGNDIMCAPHEGPGAG
jgi:hypothetical protein